MLQTLTIENIALIKQLSLEFPAGFVALTGETGAGKSILIDAINTALGERTSREIIRTGAESARVAAIFSNYGVAVAQILMELDIPAEPDGTLLLQRSITAAGKNQCRVNGNPVTVSALRRLGQALINIHGQHDTQALLAQEQHIHFVDAMAENAALRAQYREKYHALRQTQRTQDALRLDESEKARRLDMLRYQIAELEEAEIQPGERAALQKKQSLCRHTEKILQALGDATACLSGDGDTSTAAELAHASAGALEQAGMFYPAAAALAERVRAAAYELEEAALELRTLAEGVEFDPAAAEKTEQRLDLYFRLSRKYGETEEELLAFLEAAQAEESAITQSDERINALEDEITALRGETIALAKQLTRSRREAAARFSERVCEELTALDMPSVRFLATHEKIPLTAEGGDNMAFLISANIGEEPRPLARIASGGELSRVMLAIKNVLAEKDAVATLIFDEVDAGVSGRAAQKIARKLRQVSRGRQVICVTHLAQIAAPADCHLCISKSTRGGETFTSVTPLDAEGRKRELARIMGGEKITPAQLAAAAEMLAEG
ncbi:MAG: DNA repair protein RecN [Oscillospiraceae bacterium]|jgi:DNA repair protein RecN (Recombination protein N)|nr:DNA repair protein RecN [Oscillospiraceae bacterium]